MNDSMDGAAFGVFIEKFLCPQLWVGDWIKSHASEVIDHNLKHGMQPLDETGNPARDKNTGEIRTDSYYNKRHGKEKVTKLLSQINEQFLDGEAPTK